MDEVADEEEQRRLHERQRQADRGLARRHRLGDPERGQRLAGQADGEAELRDEIAATQAEDQRRATAHAEADHDRRRFVLEHPLEAEADEGEQEQRADPAGDAEHDAHEPGTRRCAGAGQLALDQAGVM